MKGGKGRAPPDSGDPALDFYPPQARGASEDDAPMNVGALPANIYFGIAMGFLATLGAASALNKFGNAMYDRGLAKPFYLGSHRIHHRPFLFGILPGTYVLLATMMLEGMVRVQWSVFWTGVTSTVLVGLGCLVLDLTFDYLRGEGRRRILQHEMIYLAIPVFVFTNFLRMVL